MSTWTMAWRNVWRNRRRTGVTVAAMTFALVVEILYAGLLPGFIESMQSDVVDLELGEIQVFAEDYLDRPSLYTAIDDPDALLARLDEAGYRASARLMGGGLAAAGEFSAGIALRGIDVDRDARVTRVQEALHAGRWLDPDDPRGVVVGRQLARILAVGPGDEVVVLAQAADGSMANDLFTVRGVLDSIAAGTDRSVMYLNGATFRELMVFPRGAHQVIVRSPDGVDLETARAEVVSMAEATGPGIHVMTWKEINPIVAQMLEGTSGLIRIIFFIVYLAVGILILNAMLMAVFERIREFGVLKAIGVGPFQVFALIVAEALVQTLIALVIGLVAAAPGMWYLAHVGIPTGGLSGTDMMGVATRPVWYGIYRPEDIVAGPIVMLFVVVFLAVLVPAFKAAWIRPVSAMSHQ